VLDQAYDYGVLLKPKVLLAMLALYLITFFTSSIYVGTFDPNYFQFFVGFMAVTLSVSGANALNCVYDRDIDAIMTRTRERPMAIGSISVWDANLFSGIMLTFSVILALYLGRVPVILLTEGVICYLVLYTIMLKRKTSINVLFTAPSVAAPAWFGWYLGGAPLYPVGLVMGILVAIWGPLHLWSIAYAYNKDYERVGVPMFPAQVKREKAIEVVLGALGLLIGSSYILAIWAKSMRYLMGVSILNLILVAAGLNLYISKKNRDGWILFKLTSPYIILVFLVFLFSQFLNK
jgi:protoheme IX farnesyltransferase